MRFESIIVIVVLFIAACHRSSQPESSQTTGIDVAGMDKAVKPGDDFNKYTNGHWLQTTEIPADKASYGSDAELADQTRKQTVDLIQGAAKAGNGSGDSQKVGDFYSSFMDEAAIESKGIAPLKPQLDAIAAIKDKTALSRFIGGTLRADVDPLNNTNFQTLNLFGVWITQSLTNPDQSVPYLLQGGLGMPDREYYVADKPDMVDMRKHYQAHIAAMLKLAGLADSDARAARIFDLETKIARGHATRVESEDVHAAQTWKREELETRAPGINWSELLTSAGLNDAPTFIAWHPKAIPALSALVAREPLNAWQDWLSFHAIEHAANFLPKAFVDEHFAFFGKTLNGIPELRPRWQRGVDFTSDALGEVVGKMYVERYFPPESKAKVQELAAALVKAFGARIDSLTWMSPQTKTKAKEKLATLKVGVGYPDKWIDYSALQVSKDDALGNE
ncbi:MAG TPA: M13 family metallopeptidase N-terminal domain-containing protein, partial [Candidatus Tectomicrobia bacterium]|nr:M13 family metallopeptidase N-terminal domain-containing protein [Candidatus Tectomicrobia bacterium]